MNVLDAANKAVDLPGTWLSKPHFSCIRYFVSNLENQSLSQIYCHIVASLNGNYKLYTKHVL